MTRCKSCLIKAEPRNECCPVCGIGQNRKRAELSPGEKKVRFHARCILGVAGFHLAGIALCLYILLILNPAAAKTGGFVFAPALLASLAILNLILAYGLSRYAFWAYRVAVALYFLLGIAQVVSVQIPGILLVLTLLYFIGNATAKSLFERRGPNAPPESGT